MANKVLFYTLAFGREEYYRQSQLLAVSLLHYRLPDSVLRIYTDRPDFFAPFREHLEIEPVSKESLLASISEHKGYLYSSKLNLIQQVNAKAEFATTVFLDTDVIARQPLDGFIRLLEQDTFLMYRQEKAYARESRKEYWQALNRIDLLGHRIDSQSSQWNSGVVGLSGDHRTRLLDAASIMDQLNEAGVKQHTLEQVALSVVFEHTGRLQAATDWFVHYYANKPAWKPIADELETLKQQGKSLPALTAWFAAIPAFPSETPPQPDTFSRLVNKWKNSIIKRLPKRAPNRQDV